MVPAASLHLSLSLWSFSANNVTGTELLPLQIFYAGDINQKMVAAMCLAFSSVHPINSDLLPCLPCVDHLLFLQGTEASVCRPFPAIAIDVYMDRKPGYVYRCTWQDVHHSHAVFMLPNVVILGGASSSPGCQLHTSCDFVKIVSILKWLLLLYTMLLLFSQHMLNK